jgi:PAS domain S-box-containing protein
MTIKNNTTLTEQHFTDKELGLKTDDLQWLLNSMLNAFVIFDPVFNDKGEFVSYRFVHINKAYEEITGVKQSEVQGKTIHEIWPKTEDSWVEKYGHVSTTGETLIFDNYHEPTKKLYHCRVFRPWEESQRFCVVFDDVTEQILTRTELEKNEQRYRLLIENLSEGIGYYDLQGKVILFNKRAAENMGGLPEHFVGKSMVDLYGQKAGTTYHKRILAAIKSNTILEFEDKVTLPGGTFWFISRYNKIYDDNGSTIGVQVIATDITESKTTEIELKKAEEMFRTISENFPNSYISIIEKDLTIGHTAGQEFKKTGLDPQSFIGLSLKDIFGDREPVVKEHYLKTFKGEEQEFELFINDQWQHYKTVPLRNEKGEIDRILSVVENITERKNIEIEFVQLNKTLKSAQEMAMVGYWSFDIKTQVPTWSDQMFKICGYNKEDGAPSYNEQKLTWHPDDWKMFDAAVKACEKGTPYNIVVRIWFPKENCYHYINTKGFPQEDTNGKIVRLFGTSQDITDIKLAQLKIEESEYKYRNLITTMMNAFGLHEMIFDKKGNPVDYRFLEVNPAWEKIVGIKTEDVIGKTIKEIMPGVEESWIKLYGRIVKTGIPEEFEDYNRATGKYYHVYAYSPEAGKFAVFFNDITNAKEAEKHLLIAKNEAERYLDLAGNMILTLDREANITLINKKGLEILGYTKDELLGQNWFDICIPKDKRNDMKNVFSQIIQGKISQLDHYENEVETKTGEIKLISWYNTILRDEHDQVISALSSGVDITEQRKSEKTLNEQKTLLDSIIDESPIPLWISDKHGVLIRCNKSLLDTLNVKENDIIGNYNILNDENIIEQGHLPLIRNVFDKKHTIRVNLHWKKIKSGIPKDIGKRDLYLDATLFPICDNFGNLQHVVCKWIDITESVLINKALKESEEKYRFLVENQNDLLVTFDYYKKVLLFANPNYYRIFGLSEKDIVGKSFIPMIHKDDQTSVKASIASLEKPPYTSYHEERAKTVKGWRWIGWSLKAVRNEEGQITQTIAVGRDITDRKEAEKKLQVSENRFRELVNTISSGVAIYKVINDGNTGDDYIIQDFNKTALKMEMMEKQDVIGKSLKDIRPNIDEYGLIPIFKKVWKTGESTYYPAKIYTDDKYANYYENRIFRLPNHEIVAVYDDVTARERNAEKIKESEERFELAMKASQDGLYDWNLVTNEIYYSPGWKKILGYEYNELPNDFSIWETLTKAEDVIRSWEMQQKVINKELDRFEMEFKMKHKDGHWVDILSRAEAIFDEKGKAIRMIGTHVDISERKRFENDLLNALNKAQESDRLKSAFLANISHEIRTPMNGILGFSGLLKQADLNSEKQHEYIDIIERSGKRMLNTINDLIDISRIESGQVKISNKLINFNDLLSQLYHFFKPEAKEKGLDLMYEPTLEDNKALVSTDEEKLFAIMSNYLKNAIKYTQTGSIHLGYKVKDSSLEFFVKDSGIGIPKEKHDAVFERFVQADLSITKPYEGSGLGLAISKAFAEMIGGKVRLESEPGKGSIFYLRLPLNNTETISTTKTYKNDQPKQTKEELKDLDLMIVEDDEASVLYLKILLENKCSSLMIAKTGGQAIKLVKDHPEIDLILMDVRMPDMDGYTATNMIREFNKDVLIIAQTAYAMESDRDKAIEAGCNGYISKPISEDLLFSTIREFRLKKH